MTNALRGPDGRWSARDLQAELGYVQWRNFEKAVLAARHSIEVNDGVSAAYEQVADSSKQQKRGLNGATQDVSDYRLTRNGAYRVMLECDGSKPAVAAAKHYFTIRTREAELVDTMDEDLRLIIEGAKALQETRREVRELRIARQRQEQSHAELVARVDSMEGRSGWQTVMAFSKTRKLPTHLEFRQKLGSIAAKIAKEQGVIPGKTPDERWGTVNCYPISVLEQAHVRMGTA